MSACIVWNAFPTLFIIPLFCNNILGIDIFIDFFMFFMLCDFRPRSIWEDFQEVPRQVQAQTLVVGTH